jgi:hypothetical protein
MVGGTGVIVLLSNLGNKDFDWTVGIAALVVITLIPTIIAAISTGLFKSSDK